MVIIQDRSLRKPTGGRYKNVYAKRVANKGNSPALTKLSKLVKIARRTRGGHKQFVALAVNQANVLDPKTKKITVVEIKNIKENPANRHYVRRNIMTKGAVIETPKGLARITNRPGQEGCVNAVLVS
ncbi:MAG TPA: 30S ribosomal protein S8e [Candidatus Nanoarchaeia archaeon]|nr:30S ribosomal protein S8e [Candidatus Nanoarchaeia archaeon]